MRHWKQHRLGCEACASVSTAPAFPAPGNKAALTALCLPSNFPLLICPEPAAIVCFAYSSCRTTRPKCGLFSTLVPNSTRVSWRVTLRQHTPGGLLRPAMLVCCHHVPAC